MKVLSKIENIVIAIVMMAARWFIGLCGFGTLFEEFLDFDGELLGAAVWVTIVVLGYVEIKRCVFRCIDIVKEKK